MPGNPKGTKINLLRQEICIIQRSPVTKGVSGGPRRKGQWPVKLTANGNMVGLPREYVPI